MRYSQLDWDLYSYRCIHTIFKSLDFILDVDFTDPVYQPLVKYFNSVSPESFAAQAANNDIDLDVFEALFKAYRKQENEGYDDTAIKMADPTLILQTDFSKTKPSELFLKETAAGVINWLTYCQKKEFFPSAQLVTGKVRNYTIVNYTFQSSMYIVRWKTYYKGVSLIVKKLVATGNRDLVAPFLVDILESASSKGLMEPLKLHNLITWLRLPLNKDKKGVKAMTEKYPDSAEVAFPADFPLPKERYSLENARLTEESKEKLVIDRFDDLLLKVGLASYL